MKRSPFRPLALFACLTLSISSAYAEETIADDPVTFWPFVDIRMSADGEKTISLLGPIIDLTNSKEAREVSVRPFYHERRLLSDGSSRADIVYPIASRVTDSETTSFTVLKGLYEKSTGAEQQGKNTRGMMLFPFYISGTSEKYGPYVSIFPIYGDIYERFWRDEYHYVMFPLYSRTVKRGTVSTNYLYPFFSIISGENESGFQFWPLYGKAEKVGVYKKRFAVWPVYSSEESGLDTDNPMSRRMFFPLYAAQDSPKAKSRHYLWPFFGYAEQTRPASRENYFFWPFWWAVSGEKRNAEYLLPFYASDRRENSSKTWVLWPGYRHDVINSDRFVQEKTSLLVFLYRDNKEAWPKDDVSRRKSGLWPVYSYVRSEKGVSMLSFPALLENLVDSEGIDENWAPLWRIYRQEWRTDGAASFSFLWNLVWYEQRGSRSSHEVFPLWRYTSNDDRGDFSILKGLFRFHSTDREAAVGLLWIPRVVRWEKNVKSAAEVSK